VQLDILTDQRIARLEGADLRLGARAYDVLAYLHENADRVVTKAELLDHVWTGMIVEEGNLSVQIAGLRKALGKEAIKTVPGVGYQLTIGAKVAPVIGPDVPTIPSLAVLPFANLTGDAGQDYLVDGIVAEVITALSRVSGFFVISSTSSFTYKGRAVDLAQVGCELGVRYILEGSIQRAGERLRIFTQLVEADSGHGIWQNRFDGQVADIFDLQDQIAEEVAGALEPKLIWAEAARSRAKPTESLTAYELCLRAAPLVSRMDTPDNLDEGLRLLREALKRDPGYVQAKALYCYAHTGAIATRSWSFEQAKAALEPALEVINEAHDDALALAQAGHYLAYVHNRLTDGMTALSRAERLNPNSGQVLMLKGWVHIYRDENEAAITVLTRAKRLSPLHPQIGIMTCGFGNAHMQMGKIPEAIGYFEQALSEYPEFVTAVQGLMSCRYAIGEIEEARRLAGIYRAKAPRFSVQEYVENRPFESTEALHFVVDAMRQLGFPETPEEAADAL
jgi:TolB-like protein/lipopolysaccharide biosynthesis regulator YciM